ncbi:MAG: response regulator [Chloroflexota bacterium]
MQKTILIVDDDPITINLLQLILEPAGFMTQTAQNGAEALEQVSHGKPDAILLDVMMPIMDGFTVCQELRSQQDTAQLPIIILSTSAQSRSVEKGMEAGASKYLFKPISRDVLVSEITKAIQYQDTVAH